MHCVGLTYLQIAPASTVHKGAVWPFTCVLPRTVSHVMLCERDVATRSCLCVAFPVSPMNEYFKFDLFKQPGALSHKASRFTFGPRRQSTAGGRQSRRSKRSRRGPSASTREQKHKRAARARWRRSNCRSSRIHPSPRTRSNTRSCPTHSSGPLPVRARPWSLPIRVRRLCCCCSRHCSEPPLSAEDD